MRFQVSHLLVLMVIVAAFSAVGHLFGFRAASLAVWLFIAAFNAWPLFLVGLQRYGMLRDEDVNS